MLHSLSRRLLTLLQLTRMALVFTAIADGLCTVLLSAQRRAAAQGTSLSAQLDARQVAAAAAISVGLYGFGMSLNDIIDRRRDSQISPQRPLPSGRVGLAAAHVVCVALIAMAVLGEHVSAPAPMYLGAGMVALSVVTLVLSRHHLRREAPVAPAVAVPAGVVLVAVDGTPAARHVVETAGRVARSRAAAVHVVHVRETRSVGGGTAELESRRAGRALVEAAVGRLGVAGATGEVLNVTGHHADAAEAVVGLADRLEAGAIVAGRPDRHGGELGARSMTTELTERAPCDVIVVVPEAVRDVRVAALA